MDTRCMSCDAEETREHFLFVCPWVQHLWLHFSCRGMLEVGRNSIDEWLSRAMLNTGCSREQQANAWNRNMVICWTIWKARCKLAFEGVQPFLEHLVQEVARTMIEINQTTTRSVKRRLPNHNNTWTRPIDDSMKINCDDAWCPC